MRVRLVIEYHGAAFHGWQIQPGVETVQGELSKVISRITGIADPLVLASGRTDAGVHARGQVAHIDFPHSIDLDRLAYGVNGLMRGKLSILYADSVSKDFHSRFSAARKQYSYLIQLGKRPSVLNKDFVWHLPIDLNIERMEREAKVLIGKYDFKSLQGSGCVAKGTVREIFVSELEQRGSFLVYRVQGSGFLKHMVRNIVGTLVDMAEGKLEMSVCELLKLRDRTQAGRTAPGHGLCLDWVEYPDFPFTLSGLERPTFRSEVLGTRPLIW
ncbi:MAG: tRNA pseudouridine(38-40) synthase TruA [Bdellovibrionales bacterium]|nr:tRNA pseudouridine(38-40) synthase TruA [Bdellovibrionales bacterium]